MGMGLEEAGVVWVGIQRWRGDHGGASLRGCRLPLPAGRSSALSCGSVPCHADCLLTFSLTTFFFITYWKFLFFNFKI